MFGGKRHISAQHIRAVEDHDEVYHHLLKSTYVSLSLRNPGGVAAPGAVAGDYNAATTTGGGTDYSYLVPLQRKVMELVAAEEHEDGIHVAAVSKNCGSATGVEVMEAIESLMNEGLLYSTIDDLVSATCGSLLTLAHQGGVVVALRAFCSIPCMQTIGTKAALHVCYGGRSRPQRLMWS